MPDDFSGDVPLARAGSVRLSLGVFQQLDGQESQAEDAEPLARILLGLFQQPVLDRIFDIMIMWAETEARKRALLLSMSTFFSRMEREASAIFDELVSGEEAPRESEAGLEKFRDLMEGLRGAEEMFAARASAGEVDVFVVHGKENEREVSTIVNLFREQGVKPWIASERIRPGQVIQEVTEQAISGARTAAVFVGSEGMQEWQTMEMRALVRQCVENKTPVIPVLLPGVEELPSSLSFLRELHSVSFSEVVDDGEALSRLIWGIRGSLPGHQSSETAR